MARRANEVMYIWKQEDGAKRHNLDEAMENPEVQRTRIRVILPGIGATDVCPLYLGKPSAKVRVGIARHVSPTLESVTGGSYLIFDEIVEAPTLVNGTPIPRSDQQIHSVMITDEEARKNALAIDIHKGEGQQRVTYRIFLSAEKKD
ncbi:MAG: hypothetical protein Q7R96_03485 [Nanoarchaeota archaeon]|nr:hypothetical protein [Nanoarchaeota archaeon]